MTKLRSKLAADYASEGQLALKKTIGHFSYQARLLGRSFPFVMLRIHVAERNANRHASSGGAALSVPPSLAGGLKY